MRWLLTIFILTLLIPHLDNFPLGNNGKYLFTALAAIAIPIGTRKVAVLPDRPVEHSLFLILWVGSIVSLLYNRDPGSIVYVVFTAVSYLLYNYIRTYGLTRQQIYIIAGIIILTCAYPRWYGGRSLMGPYGNPNLLPPTLSFALYLLLIVKKAIPWWLKFGAFLLVTYLISLTNARAGQLGYAVFIIAYVGQTFIVRRHLRILSYCAIVASFLLYIWMITSGALFIIEQANAITNSDKDADFSERDELFALFVEEVKVNPFGVGLGQSKKWAEVRYRQGNSPHNTYLKIVAEGGWLYLLGFLLLFSYLYLTNQSIAASAYLLGFCVRGLFESTTPLTLSMTSACLLLPFYLNEFSIFTGSATAPDKPGEPPLDQVGARTVPQRV